MDPVGVGLAVRPTVAEWCSIEANDPGPSDRNNNTGLCISPSTGTDDQLSTSSSDKDSQLSPDNYHDEEFYGKLKVKVRKDGKKLTEKKRRQDLQQQYTNLRMLVPGLQDMEGRTPFSRNVILKHTLNYIEHLKVCMSSSIHLANELRLQQEYHRKLQRELQIWQKKVADLRMKKLRTSSNTMGFQGQLVQRSASQSNDLQAVT